MRFSTKVAFLPAFLLSLASFAQTGQRANFIENKNQWHTDFRYGADFPGARVFLKERSLFVVQHGLHDDGSKTTPLMAAGFEEMHHHRAGVDIATFEISFINSLRPSIKSSSPGITRYNYYLGNDRSKWAQGARTFAHVNYDEIYPGIGLRVYTSGDQLKYDWLVSPCADANNIQVKYLGVDAIYLDGNDLRITTKLGNVTEAAPIAWQMVNGMKRDVPVGFKLNDDVLSFDFPQGYDPNYELIIDPTLIFYSYSGSTWDNWGNTATPDSKGNLYSGGIVASEASANGYPVTPGVFQSNYGGGVWDIGIIKYDSIGANVLYTTFLGGTGSETPQSLVVDNDDNLLILGTTSSGNFPGTISGTFQGGTPIEPIPGVPYNGTDIFIAKLTRDGNALTAATYLGGSENDGVNFISGIMSNPFKVESPLGKNYGDQLRGDITVDANNNVYIASNTLSDDFPLVNNDPEAAFHGGSHDAVIAKFSPDLTNLLWTRLIGGPGTDIALSVKVSPTNRLYVAGGTDSRNMTGMNGLHGSNNGGIDGWIYELSTDGEQILNGTFLGTTAYDQIYFIDLGVDGSVYAYGQTQGMWPISPNVFSQPGGGQFLHKLNSNLSATGFSTVFGVNNSGTSHPSPNISPTAFLVNACDNIYMAGWGGAINSPTQAGNGQTLFRNYVGGNTNNMTVTPDAFQTLPRGNDFYFMVLSPGASDLLYATFLGGPAAPTHVDGGTSRFDKRGIVYHAVCAGCRGINDFPGVNVPASRALNMSAGCNNAAFKFDLSSLSARIQTNNVQLNAPGTTTVCLPDALILENKSINGRRHIWDLGDGTKLDLVDTDPFLHQYQQPGRYIIKLKIIDESTCINVDSTTVTVNVYQPDMKAGPDTEICEGSSTRLTGTGAVSWRWTTSNNTFVSEEAEPLVSPSLPTRYFVDMTDANGCSKRDTLIVDVTRKVDVAFEHEVTADCMARPSVVVRNLTSDLTNAETYFSFGDGTETDELEATHEYDKDGIYRLTLTGVRDACVYTTSADIPIVTVKLPNVITPLLEDGLNDSFKFVLEQPELYRNWLTLQLKIYNRWGNLVYASKDYQNDWYGEGVDPGVYYYELQVMGQGLCKGWVQVIK